MRRIIHVLLVLCMFAGGFAVGPLQAAQVDEPIDLADVPLPVQALPENGYQVLSGAYLTPDDTVAQITEPRNLDAERVSSELDGIGIARAYVLDLVLPEDRAWQDSPVLAVQQTSVYVLHDESDAGQLAELLTDYSAISYVEDREPFVEGATTVAIIGEGGDMLRTVVGDGRVVIEIVSLDATGAPDETEHLLIVQGTLDRLQASQESGGPGVSSLALTLRPDELTVPFAHAQQTGVHGVYRLRNGNVQPAIGELGAEDADVAGGMQSLYLSNSITRTGGGHALVSVWLGSFSSEDSASAYFDLVIADSPGNSLSDPYFQTDPDEAWTPQGIVGLYRVTGTWESARYSGNVEIRVAGNTVVVVGYRSIGASVPGVDITSALMDHQLGCIAAAQLCPPFDLASVLPPVTAPPMATPVTEGSRLGSTEFGWMLPELGPEWTVTEQFAEPGYDRIGIQNGLSLFEFESVINHHGEPVQCVLDELHMLQVFEEHADIRVWEDANGNTEGGNTATSAWVVYRVEPLVEERADQEYVIRIDCFTLIQGTADLVMTHIAPVDVWEQEAPKGDILRNGLMLPEAVGQRDMLVASAHDRRTNMILTHWIDRAA
jgi:hypothetical protein